MSSNPHFLAIDLGTSSAKLALVSAHGIIVDHEVRDLTLRHLPNGGVEQSPAEWWQAVCEGTRALVARASVPAADIVAVSCTSQWSGTVAVDERGEPLCDAILWMDTRGAPHVRKAVRGLVSPAGYGLTRLVRWVRLTGGLPSLSGKDSLAHILYLREERPEIYRAAHKLLEPMDYLNLRLSGRFSASFATITLHWATDNRDLRRVRYVPSLLASVGLDGDKLPPLSPSAAVLGPIDPAVARSLGLGEHVQIVTGTPDVHSAAIGSGAVRDRQTHLCLGTSSWLAAHLPFKKTDLVHTMASLPSAIPDRYLLVAEQESAGVCLSWLRDQVLSGDGDAARPPSTDTLLSLAATAPPGSDGLLFGPWLNGERLPVDEHRARGAFFNLSLRTGRAHLIRAVLEGVAFNVRWLLGHVERFVAERQSAIPIVGGAAESDLWCRILADVLDRPIQRVRDPRRANVRGAAFIGAVALGLLRFDEIPGHVPITRTFEPDRKNSGLYDDLFAEYRRLADLSFELARSRPSGSR